MYWSWQSTFLVLETKLIGGGSLHLCLSGGIPVHYLNASKAHYSEMEDSLPVQEEGLFLVWEEGLLLLQEAGPLHAQVIAF